MTINNQPTLGKKQLLKSVGIALIIGAIVLLTAVLPAENGIDPLGTGKFFGFGKLYQDDTKNVTSVLNYKKIKMEKLGSPSDVPKPIEVNNPPAKKQYSQRKDSITVIVPAKKGVEYKVKTRKYAVIKYEWLTDNNIVYTDFHGEVFQENPPKNTFYESYTLAYSNNMAGTLTTPFRGKHGWYFRNDTDADITVTLKLDGEYEFLK